MLFGLCFGVSNFKLAGSASFVLYVVVWVSFGCFCFFYGVRGFSFTMSLHFSVPVFMVSVLHFGGEIRGFFFSY